MADKSVLVGLHGSLLLSYEISADHRGYGCVAVRTLPEMLGKARERPFDVYWMDINLGKPGSEDIEPARQVYEVVRSRVESGEAKFLAVSMTPGAVEFAKAAGIPAEDKATAEFGDFLGPLIIRKRV